MPAYRFLVDGRVQGVGYRYFARQAAESLRVSGFARNLPDGRVEVVAEAGDDALTRFEERLREGPSFAVVDAIEREAIAPRGDAGFQIR
jgi:acylphosphatase